MSRVSISTSRKTNRLMISTASPHREWNAISKANISVQSWVRSSLVGRVEDWRVSLDRSSCSRVLEGRVAKELHCPLESRSRVSNSLATLRRITQIAVERSTERA